MSKPQERYVYVITDGCGASKIGIAEDTKKRLGDLQVGSSVKLRLAHAIAVPYSHALQIENRIHKLLKDRRLKGEWFFVAPRIVFDAIRGIIDGPEKMDDRAFRKAIEPKGGTKIRCPTCTHWRVIYRPKNTLKNRKFRCVKCDSITDLAGIDVR